MLLMTKPSLQLQAWWFLTCGTPGRILAVVGVSLWTLALTGRQSVLGSHWAVRKSNIFSKSGTNGVNTAVLQ